MWHYETTLAWAAAKEGHLHAGGKPDITVATPPEFGGPENLWTPEDLLAGAAGACLLTSALHYIERAGVALHSYTSNSAATMEKTRRGLAITGLCIDIAITVRQTADVAPAERALEKAESTCPITGVLSCPVTVNPQIRSLEEVDHATL